MSPEPALAPADPDLDPEIDVGHVGHVGHVGCIGELEELAPGLRVVLATVPLPEGLLTAGESECHRLLPPGPRARQWRTARAALRSVLVALGETPDTAGITFPHPRFSLSHGPEVSVAAGLPDGRGRGLGVDVEARRPVGLETARFFLTPAEHDWLSSVPDDRRPDELLRLWTVKEAAFKANLANAGTTLIQYGIDEPGRTRGTVVGPAAFACSYATAVGGFGYLSVASATSTGSG